MDADFDRSFRYTGRELCRLMRTNRVTIRDLSSRTGITLRIIRERRNRGDAVAVRGFSALDWHEAITGELTPRMRAALRQRSTN